MSTSVVISSSINTQGISPVEVEVSLNNGLPYYNIVGLADSSIKESRERVKFAIKNSNILWPNKRITVNLSPAWLSKKGSTFDLAIAIGILQASSIISTKYKIAAWGELSLDGEIKSVPQALALTHAFVDSDIDFVILPKDAKTNVSKFLKNILYFSTLNELISFFNTYPEIDNSLVYAEDTNNSEDFPEEFLLPIDIQPAAWRACQLAIAGGHNFLMLGSAGSGKTTLGRASRLLMPKMGFNEVYNSAVKYSALGLESTNESGFNFREPHHSITRAAMIGGSYKYPLGEVSLADGGLLFLDEIFMFNRDVINQLRKIMDDAYIERFINGDIVKIESDFILIAASNPCNCGEYFEEDSVCTCSDTVIKRFRDKLSDPFFDRFDLFVTVNRIPNEELEKSVTVNAVDPQKYRKLVNEARDMQASRYANTDEDIKLNSRVSISTLKEHMNISDDNFRMFNDISNNFKLSIRVYQSVLRLSRTIADFNQHENIELEDLLEAFSYRKVEI